MQARFLQDKYIARRAAMIETILAREEGHWEYIRDGKLIYAEDLKALILDYQDQITILCNAIHEINGGSNEPDYGF